jgi:glycerol-3-phosphate dehydrogenase subunit B
MTGAPARIFDVAVVGAGMAGMASALFAAQRGLSCVQVGNGGGILFSTSLLDLLAVHPLAERREWTDAFAALAALAREAPDHPMARVDAASIRAAFGSFVAALGDAGLPYAPLGDRNLRVLTSIGTTRLTWAVPRSMVAGAAALSDRVPCLLVDFRGLREYSARQITASVGARWPGLRSVRVEFPGFEAVPELYAAHLATALESHPTRAAAIERIRPLLGDARAVGLPAILGIARSGEVHAAFEAALGVPVFEIPTMPTSVPGLRLRGALEAAVAARGVHRHLQATVASMTFDPDGAATIALAGAEGGEPLRARAVVLATGRFTGRGLTAERGRVVESILGLPVRQPRSREQWHRRDFLDPAGHAVNRAGLRTDAVFRPLDEAGKPAWPRLFAAGSILAEQDWMREKCGSGLAIATAWAVADEVRRQIPGPGAAG